jgi:outer membrane protein assembly factor BamB
MPTPRSFVRTSLLFALLLAGLAGLPRLAGPAAAQDAEPAPSGDPGITMFRGDPMRTGAQPGPAPEGNPVVKWQFATDGAVRSSPAVVDGAVYFGSKDGNVYALEAATGKERWRFETGGPIVSSPAVYDGIVVIGSQDGYLYGLDASTGERRWHLHLWGVGSPTVSGGLIYISTTGNTLHVIDAKTGLERWHAAFTFSITEPAVAGQTVFVGADGVIQAFDKNNGLLRWIFDVTGTASASPVVSLGRVYAVVTKTAEGEVRIEDDQAESDNDDVAPDADERSDAGGGGVGAQATSLVALDTESGAMRWQYQFATNLPPVSSMALVDGILYAGSDRGWLYALDPNTGFEHWGYQTNGAVIASPVVAGGQVFIGSYGGGFHVLDAKTGEVKWVQDFGAPVASSAAVLDGVVYVGSDAGTLFAIGGSGAPAT